MAKTKRSWDFLSEDQRRTFVNEIINFFGSQRDEQIGIIAAEEILDMFLQTAGSQIYNMGVNETKDFFKNRFEEINTDIEIFLKKQ